MAETCATCKYFHLRTPERESECRIKAPLWDGFPNARPSGWCGEYSAVEAKKQVISSGDKKSTHGIPPGLKLQNARHTMILRLVWALTEESDYDENIVDFLARKMKMANFEVGDMIETCGIVEDQTVKEFFYGIER